MTVQATRGVDEFDIVIIGAGISGIGAAAYFRKELPGKSIVILEARA
jgi:cation diffusion facilitator CzcD-associated flavoprotein CzcO